MLLETVNSPEDLKKLPDEKIPVLCEEIRAFIVENVTRTGGHLASNLGIVELTLALHKVFDSPHDRIIFDVGHQAYVHKLITGRRDGFANLRRKNGCSGFTKADESVHDPFGAGHSSTSVSAALGFAKASRLDGDGRWTVAVVGDGAFTGGMVYEALNNCEKDLRLMIVLNDNEMSISKSVGTMSDYISDIRSSKQYIKLKRSVSDILSKLPVVGENAVGIISDAKEKIRNFVVFDSNFFERMGLRYYGPVDGNDYEKLKLIISEAKRHNKSCIVHVTTEKGLGYPPAYADPRHFHAIPPANAKKSELLSFSAAFGKALCKLAKSDPSVCAITAAMCDGTGLSEFANKFPDRFFDVGIAEEHAVTFASGLAAAGKIPVFAVYSSFLQRAYDNLIHDVSLQNLHLVLGIDRAGLSPDDGCTHHGIYDAAFLCNIGSVTLLSPISTKSIEPMLAYASKIPGIAALRYPKGSEDAEITGLFYKNDADFRKIGIKTYGGANGDVSECKYVFLTYGRLAKEAVKAADILNEKEPLSAGVILLEIISPKEFIYEKIAKAVNRKAKLIFAEEGIKNGGAGMITQCALSEKYGIFMKVLAITEVPDRADSFCDFCKMCGLDGKSLAESMKE